MQEGHQVYRSHDFPARTARLGKAGTPPPLTLCELLDAPVLSVDVVLQLLLQRLQPSTPCSSGASASAATAAA